MRLLIYYVRAYIVKVVADIINKGVQGDHVVSPTGHLVQEGLPLMQEEVCGSL